MYASLLQSYLDFFYAKEILFQLPRVNERHCQGCIMESLSQTDHTCFLVTKRAQLSLYLDEVLDIIDENSVIENWIRATSALEDVYSDDIATFELKLRCPDWRATMKTSDWKYRILKTTAQVLGCERYFR